MDEKLRTLHLFAGAGGGLLSDLILGHEPVCAVEWDAYCCAVLRERAGEGWFPNLQVFEGDIRMFNASDWKGRVDLIHAGFPCQPHSVAGKRHGANDDRNLWPECVRVIREIRPRWIFLENVPGLISNGFIGTVLGDLARLGYDARWTVLGSDQVGAPHRRDRWWCLAYAEGQQDRRNIQRWVQPDFGTESENVAYTASGTRQREAPGETGYASQCGQDVPDPSNPEPNRRGNGTGRGITRSGDVDGHGAERTLWWESESQVGRVVDGISYRVDRLKSLGNAQVPLQAALAFEILMGRP